MCVFVHRLDVRVCGPSRHTMPALPCLSVVRPACADEAVGRGLPMRGKPEGPFCEYADEGHV